MVKHSFCLGSFPSTRLRRNRRDNWSRQLVAEHQLSPSDLILPAFVHEETETTVEISSMPGVYRHSIKSLIDLVGEARELGIPVVAIFPSISSGLKNAQGSEALNPENLVCRAVHAIKEVHQDIGIMADVALDPYTNHGHDGLVQDNYVVNDETIEVLATQAIIQADAGCDVISPSDMMDGRIGVIRAALDQAGHEKVRILAYSAKYASALYGPFRDAVGSKLKLSNGDKKTYQLDPANSNESLREIAQDISEGADMVMVKPGMLYLDILQRIKSEFLMPTYAYQVSGEYSMMKSASLKGWLDWEQLIMESLLAFKRAGADGILSYASIEVAQRIKAG